MRRDEVEKVSMRTKLSYGFGGFGKDFSLNFITIFLFFYYTDVVGVSAAFVGTVFLVARIWDTINDPMIGYIVSRTRTRWGRYKPWILVGNLLNALFIVALFSAHQFSGMAQLVFIATTYIGWGVTFTMIDAPFWSMIPTIAIDKREREKLMPYPRLCASLAGYTAGGVGVAAVRFLGGDDQELGYMLFATISAGLGVASALVTCLWTEQTVEIEDNSMSSFNYRKAVSSVFKNDQFVVLLLIAFPYNFAINMAGGLILYFYTYVLNDNSLMGVAMLWAGLFGSGSLVLFPKLIRLFGRQPVFQMSLMLPIISASFLCLATFVPDSSRYLIPFVGIAFGLSNALYWLMILLMVSDTVDYGDVKLGVRSESVFYSSHTLVIKCIQAVTGFLVGMTLTWINYVPNQDQTVETLTGLKLVVMLSSLLCIVSFFIYRKYYRLNGTELDNIQEKLQDKYEVQT